MYFKYLYLILRLMEFQVIISFLKKAISLHTGRGCLRGVMVKAIDCGTVEREFVLQSRYYVKFRANTHWKGMNPLILPAMS